MKRSSTFEVFHSAGDDSNKEGKRPRRSQDGDRNRPRRSQDGDGNPPDGGDNPPDGDDIPGAGPIWELHTSSDVAGVQCVHALTPGSASLCLPGCPASAAVVCPHNVEVVEVGPGFSQQLHSTFGRVPCAVAAQGHLLDTSGRPGEIELHVTLTPTQPWVSTLSIAWQRPGDAEWYAQPRRAQPTRLTTTVAMNAALAAAWMGADSIPHQDAEDF